MEIVPERYELDGIEVLLCRFANIEGRQRDNERRYARELLSRMFGRQVEICHTSEGKPYIEGASEISVSHTKGIVAVARPLCSADSPIGVDIEYLSDRVLRVVGKFLGESEIAVAKSGNVPQIIGFRDFCIVAWCAKEAAFKKLGLHAVDFKDHFKICAIDGLHLSMSVYHPELKSDLFFRYLISDDFVLVAG